MKKLSKSRSHILIVITSLFFIALLWLVKGYEIIINHSASLPIKVAIIKKHQLPKQGDIFAFYVRNNPAYQKKELKFLKILGGKKGDLISFKDHADDRVLLINDKIIGPLRKVTTKKMPLNPIKEGIIPADKFFAYSPHPRSYDSRYDEVGLVDINDIIGKAIFYF